MKIINICLNHQAKTTITKRAEGAPLSACRTSLLELLVVDARKIAMPRPQKTSAPKQPTIAKDEKHESEGTA
jgi:hypothetical protein